MHNRPASSSGRSGAPKSQDVQQAIQMLRGDAQMRAVFIGKIAAPVASKMLECGLVP